MKIEIGKYYMTRAGHPVQIETLSYSSENLIGGFIRIKNRWNRKYWPSSGKAYLDETLEDELDIVSEWPFEDPIQNEKEYLEHRIYKLRTALKRIKDPDLSGIDGRTIADMGLIHFIEHTASEALSQDDL